MPDPQPQDPSSSQERLALRRIELSSRSIGWMINLIAIIAGVIALAVVVCVIVLAINGHEVPPVLSNWGGIILGFYFGQFINLVKDYMGILSNIGASSSGKE